MLFLALVLCGSYVAAEEFKGVTADELKKMIDEKENVVVVDARNQRDFGEGHIPTAINVSPEKVSNIQQYLPADKDTLLIFYCRSGAG